MKDISDIRRKNLGALVDKNGLSNIAKKAKKPASQINDMLAGRKSFGEKVARSLEKNLAPTQPSGWLDIDKNTNQIEILSQPVATKNKITINQFDAYASMGTGLELPDQPGVIQSWNVDKQWLDLNVRTYSAAKNLCIVTGFGDSMIGMFNPGDPLLVDMGVKTVEFDAPYFFRIDNRGYIKRLQRIPTENGLILKAISANKEVYEPFDITEKMDFQVIGRVLKVWKSTDF